MQTHLRGRDVITLQDFTKDELDTFLDVAFALKRARALGEPHAYLRDKVLAMPIRRTANGSASALTCSMDRRQPRSREMLPTNHIRMSIARSSRPMARTSFQLARDLPWTLENGPVL